MSTVDDESMDCPSSVDQSFNDAGSCQGEPAMDTTPTFFNNKKRKSAGMVSNSCLYSGDQNRVGQWHNASQLLDFVRSRDADWLEAHVLSWLNLGRIVMTIRSICYHQWTSRAMFFGLMPFLAVLPRPTVPFHEPVTLFVYRNICKHLCGVTSLMHRGDQEDGCTP